MKKSWINGLLTSTMVLLTSVTQGAITVTPQNDLGVFEPGKPAVFNFKSDAQNPAKISYKVTNFEKECVKEGALSDGLMLELNQLLPGYYELDLTAVDKDGAIVDRGFFPFAVIPIFDRTKSDWSKNQFGAMVMPHHYYPLKDRELDARFMDRAGIRFVRSQRLCWIQMQPNENKPIDWDTADKEVEIYQKYDLAIVANTGWPLQSWAAEGEGRSEVALGMTYPKEEYIKPLTEFMTALAARYKDKVAYWEIGNEVDANLFWSGRLESARSGDSKAIIKDFADYYTLVAEAIHKGDPNAQVGPNTTGAAPDGTTYRNWLSEFLKHDNAVKEMDYFSTHYKVDLEEVRAVLAEKNKEDVDIIITELGGICSPLKDVRNPNWDEKIFNIPITYNHYATELFHNGKALCYFLLRELTHEPPVNWLTGLMDKDFKLFPEYVTYATMVRMLAGADPLVELNLVNRTDKGWGLGYAFTRNGEQINVIMIMDADDANITVDSKAKTLLVTDAQGREKTVDVVDGKVTLPINKYNPLFITGVINGEDGPVEYPKPVLIKEYKADLIDFESAQVGEDSLPNLRVQTVQKDRSSQKVDGFTAAVTDQTAASGKKSFMLKGDKRTSWYALVYDFPEVPALNMGEYAEVTVRYKTKRQDIVGTGVTMAVAWYEKNGVRHRQDTAFEWGTSDWEDRELTVDINQFPKDVNSLCVEFYLGNATGTLYLDDIDVSYKVYRKSGADTERVN